MKQVWRAIAYTPNGDRVGAIPTPTDYSFSVPLNDISGCTLNYLDGAIGWELLKSPVEIAMEYSVDNGLSWTEFPNGRYMRLGRGNDQINPNNPRSYTLPGYGWLLNKMRQMKITGLNADGKRMFNSANAGMIMKTLIDEAHSRGICTGLGYAFTTSADSAGNAWNKVLSIGYEPGLDLFTILNNLSQQGIVDWYFQGRVLRVFNAETTLAPNSGVVLQPTVDITGLPVQASYEDLAHEVLVVGDNGKKFGATSIGVPEPWGRWEGYVGQGGVSDSATLTILGQAFLQDGDHEKRQYTAEVDFASSQPEVMVAYRQGSYITIPTDEGKQSFRIRQLNFSQDGDGTRKLDLIINDRFVEREIKNTRRVNGITGGASIGGNGTPPTKDPAARKPAKPVGLVVDSVALINTGGGADAWATLAYPDVDVDVDGVALEIAQYRFRARRPSVNRMIENPSFEAAYTGQSVSATAAPSTDWRSDGLQSLKVTPTGAGNDSVALPVGSGAVGGTSMIKLGVLTGKKYVLAVDIRVANVQGGTLNANARTIQIGVRNNLGVNTYPAISTAAPNKVGTTTRTVKFTVPSNAQDVFVRLWNGSSRAADVVYFDNMRVYLDTESPWDSWDSWGSSSGLTHGYGPLATDVTWQVQFAAVSEAGVQGDWSDSVEFTTESDIEPPPVPSAPLLTTRLGTLTIRWDGLNADGLAMPLDFDRVLVHQLGVADPIGSIANRQTPMVLSEVVIGDEYEFWLSAIDRSGNEGGAGAHSSITVASIMDDPEAALDIQNGVTVASGGNFNTYSPNDPSGSGTKENDKWFKLTGGVTVGVWRWDGAAWVAETLDNQVIANLDAGKITTGTLAAARIAAGSITTDKIEAGAITGAKLSVDAIDGKTINGAIINGGAFSTNGRTSFDDFNTGVYMRADGVTSFRAAATPAVAGGHMMLISPVGDYVRIGTPGNGNGGYLRIDGNGRIRTYLNSTSALFLDINPSVGSQNMRVGGALFADQIAVGNAMAGTQYGGLVSDSTNGAQIMTTGNRHILITAGGTGQVRSTTIADDVLTHATTISAAIRTDTGQMGIVGSSQRFKVNIQPYEFEGDILSLSPKSWYDRREMEAYVEMLDNIAAGIDPTPEEYQENIDPMLQGHGLIAEEVEKAGFGEFVVRNADGDIVALNYDRLWVALLPVVRGLRDRVTDLEERLAG